ncbi:uncharacterized protein EDB91DRAFT_1171310, partial [Suillus paluster]|uniref:uncharacterized protein n=1 Tax=Suillus paluster TaxID=48578 RepID=UPI001B8709EB
FGLCMICQDQEANIAIVDCGHLAMCCTCSELVLALSQRLSRMHNGCDVDHLSCPAR